MTLQDSIINWVRLDNKIRKLNDELKEYKVRRNELSETINVIAEEQDMQHAVITLNDGGTIRLQEKRTTGGLTLKYVEQCLAECINNESQVEFIMSYIKSNREVKTSKVINRTTS